MRVTAASASAWFAAIVLFTLPRSVRQPAFGARAQQHAQLRPVAGRRAIAIVPALFGPVRAHLVRMTRSASAALAPHALTGCAMVVALILKFLFDDFFDRQTRLFYFAVTGMLGAHARLRRARQSAAPTA